MTPDRPWIRLGERVSATVVLLGVAALAGPAARASQPPDWLATVLNSPGAPGMAEGTDHALLEEDTVRYLPGGKMRETYRQVIRIDAADGAVAVVMGNGFNTATDRVLSARAWIVSPDRRKTSAYNRGDFIERVGQLSDLTWDNGRVIVFSRAGEAQVGGTIACELEIERQTGMVDAGWSFLERRPVGESVFTVTPLPGEQLVYFGSSPQIPAPVAGPEPGSLRWARHDLVPLPRNLPGGFIANPQRLFVRCTGPTSLANQMKTWSEFAGLGAQIVEPRMGATAAVVAQAQALVRGKATRWERIRALTEGVQKQVSYLSTNLDHDSLAGLRPHTPDEVLQSHLGDCKDKSTLLVALLRSLGETAYAMVAHANNPQAVMPQWPSQAFNHMVVAIASDAAVPPRWPVVDAGPLGKMVVFDPTDPFTPLGVLPQSDQLGYGLILSEQVPGLVTMPAELPAEAGLARKVRGQLTARGELTAEVDEVLAGAQGARAHEGRINLGAEKFGEQLESRLHATLPLLSEMSWTEQWDPTEARRHLSYKFKAANSVRMAGADLMLVCPRLVGGDSLYDPWKTDWEGAVWLPCLSISEEVRLELPEKFSLESLPKDWSQELRFVQATLKYRLEGKTLVYTRSVARPACLLGKADYEAVSHFAQKLEEAERRPAVLRRVGPAAGG